jgi:hypothetical protein
MTGNELRLARIDLGRRWRLKRPVFASELGRALGYQAQDPGESIRGLSLCWSVCTCRGLRRRMGLR